MDFSDQKQLLSAYVRAISELSSLQAKLESQAELSRLAIENAELKAQLAAAGTSALQFQTLLAKTIADNDALRMRVTKLEKAIKPTRTTTDYQGGDADCNPSYVNFHLIALAPAPRLPAPGTSPKVGTAYRSPSHRR